MSEKQIIFYQNPKIQYLFGLFGNEPVPTKQDKFKPVNAFIRNDDGADSVLDGIYIKNPDINSINEFETAIKNAAQRIFSDGKLIKKPQEIEVILSISVTEKRYKTVDVDNLAKFVLDALTGVAYDDDSQIASLIVDKHIHASRVHAILIGVTSLTEENTGFRREIKLYSTNPW